MGWGALPIPKRVTATTRRQTRAHRDGATNATVFTGTPGCGPGGLGAQQPAPAGAEWWLSVEARIGSVDEPGTALTTVTDGLIDPDGRLFLFQPMSASVRVFSPEGRPVRRIGSPGPGPGEFSSPWSMGWAPEGLYVVDRSSGRIAVFDTAGELVRDWRPPIHVRSDMGFPPVPEALLTGGRVLVTARRAYGTREASGIPERYFMVDSLGHSTGMAFERSTAHSRYAIRNPEQPVLGYFNAQPFRDDELMAVDPRGRFIVVVDRSVGDVRPSEPAQRRSVAVIASSR